MPEAAPPPLIAALQRHLEAERMETHASWILLTPTRAWKIKKPIALPFLDYSTLEKRAAACRAELAINRRHAPDLYLDALPIGGTPDHPLPGLEPALEWAVLMRRFDESRRLDHVCARGELAPAQVEALARAIHAFQDSAAVAPAASRFGAPAQVLAPALENFDELRRLLPAESQPLVEALAAWTAATHTALSETLAARKAAGRVREGHGDLHLGNLVLLDGAVTPFDAIEFNEDFRWIDVASELAFTWVDLLDHGAGGLAAWLLNAWRESSGDTGALGILRWYAVYRAVVRAKVAAIRAAQEAGAASRDADLALAGEYLALAERIAHPVPPTLTITAGLSGAGKSTASAARLLADATGGTLRLRSDVERKRLFGLAAHESSASIPGGIYGADANLRTYARLRQDAATLLAAGWSVIVDAAFLRRAERDDFRALADESAVPFRILPCEAPEAELRRRLRARGSDASEATEAVLDRQLEWFEPPSADELAPSRQG